MRKSNWTGANLQGANLQGADLRGADLRGAHLHKANLMWARGGPHGRQVDLRGANLTGASTTWFFLKHSRLEGANLAGLILYVPTSAAHSIPDSLRQSLGQLHIVDDHCLLNPGSVEFIVQGEKLNGFQGCHFPRGLFFPPGLVLRSVNFANATLEGADLRGVEVWDSNFAGARLNHSLMDKYTRVVQGNFNGAQIKDAHWDGADISGGLFSRVNFTGASLQKTNWEGAYLRRANFKGANLRGAIFDEAIVAKAHFQDAKMSRASLVNVKLEPHQLSARQLKGIFTHTPYRCTLALESREFLKQSKRLFGFSMCSFSPHTPLPHPLLFSKTPLNLSYAILNGVHLQGANLGWANLSYSHLEQALLANANLAGANLQGAVLTGAQMAYCNLKGANLTNANLQGAHLEGVDLTHTTLAGADLRGAHVSHHQSLALQRKGVVMDKIHHHP